MSQLLLGCSCMAIEPAFRKFIVVVMGSSASGVTEFIKQVSELPPQTVPDPNPSDTLKPLDYGRLTVDNANVIYLYGLSEENPLSAWTFLFDRDDYIGVVTVVDSTRLDSFVIGKTLINNIDGDIPCLMAANKQDLDGAWELDAIRIALNLHSTVPILGCSAKTGEGVREAVRTILDMLLTPDVDEEWDEDDDELHHSDWDEDEPVLDDELHNADWDEDEPALDDELHHADWKDNLGAD